MHMYIHMHAKFHYSYWLSWRHACRLYFQTVITEMEAPLASLPSRGPTHSKVDASNSMKVRWRWRMGWWVLVLVGLHDISPLNFANSVWIRDSEGLSAAWRLSGPGWFDIDLPREVVQGPPAIWHGIHLVFLQTCSVGGCLVFHLGFLPMLFLWIWTCKPYPKLVSTASFGFLGPSLKEHQTTKYNQMMYINLLHLGFKRVSNASRSSSWRSGIGAPCLHCSLTLMFVLDFISQI